MVARLLRVCRGAGVLEQRRSPSQWDVSQSPISSGIDIGGQTLKTSHHSDAESEIDSDTSGSPPSGTEINRGLNSPLHHLVGETAKGTPTVPGEHETAAQSSGNGQIGSGRWGKDIKSFE